jgi:hypothetical protein
MHHNEYLSHLSTSVAHRTKKGHFLKGPPKQRALGIAEVVIVRLDRRDLVWINVTANPTAEWIARQITEAFPWADAPQHLIRDRDRIYGTIVTRRLRAMGIRDKPTAPASPWQNGFAERLIGSIRRECVDHFVVLGEAHLHRILRAYARYYNDIRTHRSLDKDAPVSRRVQRTGIISSHAILGGFITIMSGFRFSVHTGRFASIRSAGGQ